MRKRAELFAHIQNTRSQYNLPDSLGCIAKPQNREGIAERFDNPSVQKSIAVNLEIIQAYDRLLAQLEHDIIAFAKEHDLTSYALLQTIPGVGRILALVILYEIESIERFPSVQDFVSYCRLIRSIKESNGRNYGPSGKKIGNAHLKWAFSEAAVLFLKGNEPGKRFLQRLARKHGKAKALSILAHKLGRAVYFMLKNKEAFNQNMFLRL
jgi:transposase